MGPGARLVVAAWLAVAGAGAFDKKFNITVGYLPSITGEVRGRQGLTISGAITVALEEINNSIEILPDVKILLEWHDTKSDTTTATRLVTDMSCSGVVAFFGPEGQCYTEALVAHSKNLPMFSYKCSDKKTSTLPNFVRMDPQAVKSVISLLRYYRWNKFSILYEESWATVALMLENHAKKNNMTVNHLWPVTYSFSGFWYKSILDTKNKTRIYVFLGSDSGLVEMMTAMGSHDLYAKGEYMVIFVDMEPYNPVHLVGPRFRSDLPVVKYFMDIEDRASAKTQCPITPELMKRAQSLLVVTLPELSNSSSYMEFIDKVLQYDKAEPFRFPDPFGIKFVSIHAAYLYDSVKMYATALDDLIKEDSRGEELSYDKLMSVATNGSRIVARMIKRSPYKSISGMSIQLDERADSMSNFSLLAVKPAARPSDRWYNSCSHDMRPVAQFLQSDREYPEYKLNPRLPIDWAGDVKPEDEPYLNYFNSAVHFHISSLKILGMVIFFILCQ